MELEEYQSTTEPRSGSDRVVDAVASKRNKSTFSLVDDRPTKPGRYRSSVLLSSGNDLSRADNAVARLRTWRDIIPSCVLMLGVLSTSTFELHS